MKKIKKIMFISVPVSRPEDFSAKEARITTFFPLGIAYLAAVVEKTSRYELKILDALLEGDIQEGLYLDDIKKIRYGLTDEQIAQQIRNFSPDLVGVSCLSSAMQWDMGNVCRIVKEIAPDVVTVVGGANVSAVPVKILEEYKDVDFVVLGESERSFLKLLEALEGEGEFSGLDGIVFRNKEQIHFIPKTEYIEDLDTIPFPARHLFPMKRYLSASVSHGTFKLRPFAQMITSRGCPFKCTFCSLGNHWGSRQRVRSAENVLDEIEHLISEYGIKEIHFEDDNLTADKKRALKIFQGMVKRKFDIIWHAPTGMAVASLDEEILENMKASGCYSVSLAIESGNQEVLTKLMRKPVNLKRVPSLVKKVRDLGMEARGFFIIGYPDETKQTIAQTIEFARKMELDWVYFSVASPIPGTAIYDLSIKKGYMKEGDFDPFTSFHRSVLRTPEFSPEYLVRVREEAIIDVNFRNNPNLLKYNIDKAIRDFGEVVKSYPHFDFANFYLGEGYRKKGDINRARRYYKAALDINPSYIDAKNRLESLINDNRKETERQKEF